MRIAKFKKLYIGLTIARFLAFPDVLASVSDIYGLGTRNMSLGGATNVTDAQAFAAKGNPAALTNNKDILISLDYMNSELSLTDTNSTRASSAESGITDDDALASKFGNVSMASFGLSIPLGKKLTLGATGTMPVNTFARIYTFTGNESQYLHFNEKQARPEVFTALSYQLPSNLSLGAGLFYSLRATGITQIGVSETDADARVFIELEPVIVPYVGLLFNKDKLKVGAMYRGEHDPSSNIDVDARFDVGGGYLTIPFSAGSQVVAFYDPAQLSLGASYGESDLTVHGVVERNFWSQYKAPIVQISGSDVSFVTSGGEVKHDNINLEDTWTGRLGVEFSPSEPLSLRLGGEYHTSALGDNPTSLTVIDSDRIVLNLGAGYKFKKIGDVVSVPTRFDLGAKWISLDNKDLTVNQNGAVTETASIGGDIFSIFAGVSFEI